MLQRWRDLRKEKKKIAKMDCGYICLYDILVGQNSVNITNNTFWLQHQRMWGRHVHDRMVVGFTTTRLCIQCLSPLMLWVRISIRMRYATLCDKVCPPVSSINKSDRHDITEILLKAALSTIKPNQTKVCEPFVLGSHIFMMSCFTKTDVSVYYDAGI